MNYNEVFGTFSELKEVLARKKQAIIKKNLTELSSTDETIIELVEKINRYNLKDNSFSDDEKANLKKLAEEIKVLQENNEILIKHSLNVINNILSGILNIAQNDKCSYNSRGMGCQDSESLDISSITEEA